MKVLFIAGELKNSTGMSPFIFSQGKSLIEHGTDIRYLILRGPGFIKDIKGIFTLKKHLRKETYDIIHAHYSYCGFTATFQNNTPVLLSFMGSDLLEKYGFIRTAAERYIKNRIFGRIKHFICKSEEMGKCMPASAVYWVVPNGVDLNTFYRIDKADARKKLGLREDAKYVLFASNPSRKEKNFALAAESVKEMEDPNVILLTVYDRSQAELNLFYNASDALLLTSDYEGSPNIIKEALVCGLPIVSTEVGDVRELAGAGPGNCIVPRDRKSIALKLKETVYSAPLPVNIMITENLDGRKTAMKIAGIYKTIKQR